jgi:hypothetical protein
MDRIIRAAWVAFALASSTAWADTPWYKNVQHSSGTIVSVDPAPPKEAKSLVVKTASGEVKYVISEGATVPGGLVSGDSVTVDYAVDAGGIHWANTVKKKSAPARETR